MKNTSLRFLYLCVAFALLLAACGPTGGATATPTEVTEAPPATEPPPPPPTLTPVPINLAGPDVGSSMAWADGSLLVYVPPGEFPMGVEGGVDNPLHTVFLDGFWIYKTKVTNRMYALCVGVGICTLPLDKGAAKNLEVAAMRDKPVVGINWDQAMAYCDWVEGRLPSEAEWEKVARGQGNLYPWGDAAPACDLLNFHNCVGETTKVNAYPASESFYKAWDMAGNTYEMVADWFKPKYYDDSPGENPIGPEVGTVRSVRGSSFESAADQVPLYKRFFEKPDAYRLNLGFRCVIDAPQMFPPYCQVSRIVLSRLPGGQGEGCVPPSAESGQAYVEGDNGFQNIGVVGAIASVNSNDLNCSVVNDMVVCYGDPGTTGLVTICGPCETGGPPPEMSCLPGYEQATTAPDYCDYSDGQPGGQPVGDALLFPESPLGCQQIGAYFDTGANGCVGRAAANANCLPGFAFASNRQCCEAPTLRVYPGCGQGEVTTDQGCVPPAQIEGGNCITFQVNIPARGAAAGAAGAKACGQYRTAATCEAHQCDWNGETCS